MGLELARRVYESGLSSRLKELAGPLALYSEDEDCETPCLTTIAWLVGKSIRQVQRDTAKLRGSAILVVISRSNGGAGRRTRFRLNADALPTRSPFVPRGNCDRHDVQQIVKQ
jgi:hypothetical protein